MTNESIQKITIHQDKNPDFFVIQKLIESESQFTITAPHPTGDWQTKPTILIAFHKGLWDFAFDDGSAYYPTVISDSLVIVEFGSMVALEADYINKRLEHYQDTLDPQSPSTLSNRTEVALSIIDFLKVKTPFINTAMLIDVFKHSRNGIIKDGKIIVC